MKFLIYVLSPLLALLLILVKIPEFEKWIKTQGESASYVVFGILIFGTLFNYYLTVYSPYKLLEKLAKRKWSVLAERITMLNNDYEGKYELVCNIMIPKRSFFYRIEPSIKNPSKTKFTWSGRVFKVIWQSENGSIPPDLRITVNQGVCGDAFRNGSATNPQNIKSAALIPELIATYKFNFTQKQKDLTQDLVIVASCPLVINDKGIKDEKFKVIGVLNIECKMNGAEELLKDRQIKDFYVKIAKLSNLYLNLHV